MQIEKGSIITIEDGKSYLCFGTETINDKNYLFLMSTTQPVEVRFAEQLSADNGSSLRIINQKTEKEQLAKYLLEKYQTPASAE